MGLHCIKDFLEECTTVILQHAQKAIWILVDFLNDMCLTHLRRQFFWVALKQTGFNSDSVIISRVTEVSQNDNLQ